jgi:hypothetical protein
MGVHFIIKCKKCKTVTGQCRCPSKDKSVQWIVCAKCEGRQEYVPVKKT